jgi:hypothetical protein
MTFTRATLSTSGGAKSDFLSVQLIEGVLKQRDLRALAARVATKKETAAGR